MKKLCRIFAVIGVVIVLFCTFTLPLAAVDMDDGVSVYRLRPLYNLDYIEVEYLDGNVVMFEIPSHFYDGLFLDYVDSSNTYTLTSSVYNETLVFEQMSIIEPTELTENSAYILHFRLQSDGIKKIHFSFSDSIVPYSALNGAFRGFTCYVSSSGQSYIVSESTEYRASIPFFRYDNNGVVNGKSARYIDGTFSLASSEFGTIIPGSGSSVFDDLISLFPSSVSNYNIYFPSIYVSMNIIDDISTTDDYFSFDLPLVKTSQSVSFEDYYEQYYGAYFIDSAVSFDFTSWLVVAIGSFFAFEIIPGISLGVIFMFVFGMGAVFAFLRFFAGG